MIKVLPGQYFASIEEHREFNQYLREKVGSHVHADNDTLVMYFKEKYNAVYVPGEQWSSDPGYFLFEDERDAIMFILRWS